MGYCTVGHQHYRKWATVGLQDLGKWVDNIRNFQIVYCFTIQSIIVGDVPPWGESWHDLHKFRNTLLVQYCTTVVLFNLQCMARAHKGDYK